jgi:hypothetical protein
MVDNYRRRLRSSANGSNELEGEVFEHSTPALAKKILDFKADVSSLRRVVSRSAMSWDGSRGGSFRSSTSRSRTVPRRARSPGATGR